MKKTYMLLMSFLLMTVFSVPVFGAEAHPSAADILINGEKETLQGYEIYGYTYFKLRDIDYALDDTTAGFELQYDAAKNAVFLTKGPFFYGEVPDQVSDKNSDMKEARYSGQKIYLDGESVNAASFLIDGYHYFRLRDLADILGFSVEWNGTEKTISILAEQVSPFSDDERYKEKAKREKEKLEKETEHLDDEEKSLFIRINDDRMKRGLKKLKLDDKLTQAAEIRAEEIGTKYSHFRPGGKAWYTALKEVGFSCDDAAENLASGYSSSKDVLNGWLGYEPYRKNLLDEDMEKIGVGYDSDRDTWVAIFAED